MSSDDGGVPSISSSEPNAKRGPRPIVAFSALSD